MHSNTLPTPSSDKDCGEPIAARLERVSSAVVTAINARDFGFTSESAQELLAHIDPQWKAQIDTYAHQQQLLSWPQQVEMWRKRSVDFPDVHFHITGMETNFVNKGQGAATVYMNRKVTGVSDVVLHAAMNELRWRKTNNQWLCYYTIGLRGSPGNSGGLG
ncbi:hypothetical protein DOTSEDRAFT_22069 [Dothistroma septosporum NZE10]|uniref:DUF4440 domain-containing protein n=1 Tax=Dothistroma septosporum (strain NZE10 / CBS 128990) TaxID=675120 RepID=N1PUA8_DOTSN|nr:hypothetical protein DOTSEDRAFT_22069 [Dothistroma septosporum NZE10]